MSNQEDLQGELHRLALAGDMRGFRRTAELVHASDLADVLAGLDEPVQTQILQSLPAELVSDALSEMEPEEHPEEMLARLRPEHAADIVDELEDDDAADLLGELPRETASSILATVEDKADIEGLLGYAPETAGGIMSRRVVSVSTRATAAEAIDAVRRLGDDVSAIYQVYCVDDDGRLVGVIPLQNLVPAPPGRMTQEIMTMPITTATADMDQEEVARRMARYNVVVIGVVDEDGRLLGRITHDDVIDVVEAEQTEDLLKFSGGSAEEMLGGPWFQAARVRLGWLVLNLFTASLTFSIIFVFGETVTYAWLFAAIPPVVGGVGGNAGTQALAVTVRRLALGLIPRNRAHLVVGKEILVGLFNGLVIGAAVGVLANFVSGIGWQVGVVAMAAMWGNLVVASLAGGLVPIVLDRLGKDPAVASSVFVTACTDVFGYFFFLALATKFVLPTLTGTP